MIRQGFKRCRQEKVRYGELHYPGGTGNRVLGWMRRGYRSAARRYRGHDPYHVCTMFWELEKQGTEALKYTEFEGAIVRASVNLVAGRARVRTLEDPSDY